MKKIETSSYNIVDALFELDKNTMNSFCYCIIKFGVNKYEEILNIKTDSAGARFAKIMIQEKTHSTLKLMFDASLWSVLNKYRQ